MTIIHSKALQYASAIQAAQLTDTLNDTIVSRCVQRNADEARKRNDEIDANDEGWHTAGDRARERARSIQEAAE